MQIQKLKGPPNTQDRGFGAPLNIFLFQELQRLQKDHEEAIAKLQALRLEVSDARAKLAEQTRATCKAKMATQVQR